MSIDYTAILYYGIMIPSEIIRTYNEQNSVSYIDDVYIAEDYYSTAIGIGIKDWSDFGNYKNLVNLEEIQSKIPNAIKEYNETKKHIVDEIVEIHKVEYIKILETQYKNERNDFNERRSLEKYIEQHQYDLEPKLKMIIFSC